MIFIAPGTHGWEPVNDALKGFDALPTAAGGYGLQCGKLGHMLIEKHSYCKGKDCKKHTLHKVTQCEYPRIKEKKQGL